MKHLYDELSWPEVKDTSKDLVVVLPVGTLEDHGHHLPINTDVVIVESICRKSVEKIPGEALLMPTQVHGYSPHHMDFPGPITIQGQHFMDYMGDIVSSLAHHGFKRVLMVNGHGSNSPWLEVTARKAIVDNPEILCATTNWWAIPEVAESVKVLRDSGRGGTSHACELETSLMLALRPDLVNMDKAVKDISYQTSSYFPPLDFYHPAGPVRIMPYWSTLSETGVMGDPTSATREKGEAWLNAAADGLVGIIRDFRAYKIRERVDHH
ncbi:creatininase family protein [Candidatus Bathyarchaeota archaeon]|nr:creatininase family protein [Candidatus Bathyarchaeota archaeon]